MTSLASPSRDQLADQLIAQLARMGPGLRGRFHAVLPKEREVDPATRFLDPEHLGARILHVLPENGQKGADMRATASRFTRVYCMAVVRPVVVALAMGIGLDASLSRASVVWLPWSIRGSSGTNPHALHLGPDAIMAWRGSREELRRQVLRHLFAETLAVLFERVLRLVKLSPKVLWSNAAEALGGVASAAAEELDVAGARRYIDEVDAILAMDTLPGIAGSNPLHGQVRWDDVQRSDFPHGLMTRRICCVSFTIPDRLGQYCGACPLPPVQERIDLLRGTGSGS